MRVHVCACMHGCVCFAYGCGLWAPVCLLCVCVCVNVACVMHGGTGAGGEHSSAEGCGAERRGIQRAGPMGAGGRRETRTDGERGEGGGKEEVGGRGRGRGKVGEGCAPEPEGSGGGVIEPVAWPSWGDAGGGGTQPQASGGPSPRGPGRGAHCRLLRSRGVGVCMRRSHRQPQKAALKPASGSPNCVLSKGPGPSHRALCQPQSRAG